MSGGLFNLRQLLRDLWSQKLRTALTIFGVAWGTVAITLLLAFGESFHGRLETSFKGLGENIVICWPSRTALPWEGIGKGRRIRLTEDDMEFLRRKTTTPLAGISGEYSNSLMLNYRDVKLRADVSGVAPSFGEIRNLIPSMGGRFVDQPDWEAKRRAAFFGDKLAKEVFGSTDVVGKEFLLNGSPFTVVGVLKHKDQDSSYSGRDEGKVFIAGTTYVALTGDKYVDNFIIKAADGASTTALKQEVVSIVAGRQRFDPTDREALSMWDTTDNLKFLTTFMGGFRLFLAAVGLMTLVVGGIGVSNIMNVVVEERTREIGVKLALGARPRLVLFQFLVETMLITAIGGAIGLALSAAICAAFPALNLSEFVGTPHVAAWNALAAAAVLGLVGLVAGWFPARDAARLDPAVAMKA